MEPELTNEEIEQAAKGEELRRDFAYYATCRTIWEKLGKFAAAASDPEDLTEVIEAFNLFAPENGPIIDEEEE